MAMPPPGATPDTELVLYETPAKPARHTVHDVGVIKRQMADISSADQDNFEELEVLKNLGE